MKTNNKLHISIAVCLVIIIAFATLILTGCGEQSNNSADVSANNEISEDLSTPEGSEEASDTEASTGEMSEDISDISDDVSKNDVSIPGEHIHNYSDKWSSNETDHWRECDCGEKSEIGAHSFGEWTVTEEATETEAGSKYRDCDKCGHKETASVPVLSHTHSYSDEWMYNATSHWKVCECSEKAEQSFHTYGDWTTTKEATCTATGTKEHTCIACGYSETATIPTAAHKETTIPGKAATCTEAGLTDGKKCSVCGTITLEQTIIDAKGHSMSGDTCTVCGYTEVSGIKELKYTLNSDGKSYSVTGIGTYTDKNVVIPSTYNGLPITSIGDSAFYFCQGFTSVTIPDSVTFIGSRAFSECYNLANIDLGNGIETISEEAFKGCTGLTSIEFPDSLNSIGKRAFTYCESLCDVYYPGSITAWRDINIAVYNSGLFNATHHYNGIKDLNIIDIGICGDNAAWTFYKSGDLVISGSGAISNITYEGHKTSPYGVESSVAQSIKNVVIKNGITSIGENAFKGCSLQSITIPDSVASIGESAFMGCYLNSLTIGKGVKSIGDYAFYNCRGFTSLTIPDNVKNIGVRAFAYSNALTSVTIGNGVTTIGAYAFESCSKLGNITLGNSVVVIENDAFSECSSLKSVIIPDSVTAIGSRAFYDCDSLTSITIGVNVGGLGDSLLLSCDSLTSITVKKGNLTYTSGGNCLIKTAEKKLIIGCKNSVIPANSSVTSIGDRAFYGCTGLTSIIIPDNITYIGVSAFEGCTGLTSIDIPGSVTTVPQAGFAGCTSLTKAVLRNETKYIHPAAFRDCTSLKIVSIPTSVIEIAGGAAYGGGAFDNCNNLTDVYYRGTEEQWQAIEIENMYGDNDPILNATIHYNS